MQPIDSSQFPDELEIGSRTATPEQINEVYASLGYEVTDSSIVTDEETQPPAADPAVDPAEPSSSAPSDEAGDALPGDEEDGEIPAVPEAAETTTEQKKKLSGSARARERNRRLESEIEEMKVRLAGYEAGRDKPSEPVLLPEETPKPTIDDVDADGNPKYADYEDLTIALVDWRQTQNRRTEFEAANTKRETDAQAQRTAQADAEQKAAKERWDQQLEIGASNHDDFADVMKKADDMQAAAPLSEALRDSDLGGELVYHLATHPDELARLNKLLEVPPNASAETFRRKMRIAYKEIEALEAQVSQSLGTQPVHAAPGPDTTLTTEPARESRPAAAPPAPVAAPIPPPRPKPEPITPVGNRGGATRKTLAKMTGDEIHEMQARDPDGFRRLVEAA